MSITKTSTEQRSWNKYFRKVVYQPDGDVITTEQDGSPSLTLTSSRTGERNLSHASQILRGENATTAMSATRMRASFKSATFNMVTFSTLGGTTVHDSICAPDIIQMSDPTISLTTANNIAGVNFYKNARQSLTQFRSLDFFGELTETLRMIKHPAQTLRRGIDDVVVALKRRSRGIRGSWPKRHKHRKRIWQDTWLEYAFGWAPLINDIYDGVKAYDKLYARPRPYLRCTSQGKDVQDGSVSVTVDACGIGQRGRQSTKTTQTALVIYRGMCWTQDDIWATSASQSLGFRAEDIPNAIWELTPWSFLIDYFTNIGDIISAATFPSAYVRWVSKTTLKTRKVSRTLTSGPQDQTAPTQAILVSASGGVAKHESERTVIERVKSSPRPSPTFEWEIPGLSLKWLNMAALVRYSREVRP